MSKQMLAPGVDQSGAHYRGSSRGDTAAYRWLFEQLERAIPHARSLLISTFPRGGLQLAQSGKNSDALARAYSRQGGAVDRLTWAAIRRDAVVNGRQLSSGEKGELDARLHDYMQLDGMGFVVAAPLLSPVIQGYPGALHLYRGSEDKDFTAAEARQLHGIVQEADERLAQQRANRKTACEPTLWLAVRPAARLFLYDGELRSITPDGEKLDAHIAEKLLDHARTRLSETRRRPGETERVQVADADGELWTFRAVIRPELPGLRDGTDSGSTVLFCLLPDCSDWGQLRQADLQADAELARLVPAIRFMQQEFKRSPTLEEISRAVHLSPFHFHRRFAELFGLTPKHVLLDCQINEAKRELVAREKDLADLATDCGFAHQSHFTSRFKQATGLTPTRWRRLALRAR